jgi:DNA-binding SARP family transcriptional activator
METEGNVQTIRNLIQTIRNISSKFDCVSMDFLSFILEARIAFNQGQETQGQGALRSAFGLAREWNMVYTFYWQPKVMAQLCAKALEHGIEEDYVRYIIRQAQLIPENPNQTGDSWPWPIKITTLGAFTVDVRGHPVEFSRKTQRRPLALLKALITMGGQDVSEVQLSEALWPEAEGDAAHQAWATTLHRLRELLGDPQAIQRREGKLSLHPSLCWVDALAFEALLNGKPRNPTSTIQADHDGQDRQRAVRLYQGEYLKEEDEPWIYPHRERLRGQYIRHVGYLAAEWEAQGQGQLAIGCLEEAILKEPLVEALYQQLMQTLHRQAYQAQVPTVYEQCRALLKAHLGVEPSAETTRLLETLRAR